MPKRCFILGAGFSKCCDFPLARELTRHAWRTFAQHDPDDRSPNARLVEPGEFNHKKANRLRSTIQSLFPNCTCHPENADTWPDFEQLITTLDEATRPLNVRVQTASANRQIPPEEGKHLLMEYMAWYLTTLSAQPDLRGVETVQKFVGSRIDAYEAVISFNWDLLLETAATDLGKQVCYQGDDSQALQLAKPHGSLNLTDSTREEYDAAMTMSEVREHRLDKQIAYDKGAPRIVVRAHDPREAYAAQTWAKERLIVEPNVNKRYDNHWIRLQWKRAANMLRDVEEITVIGFSLPDTDHRPRELLKGARENGTPTPKLILVDPNAELLVEHYRKLTGFSAEPYAGKVQQWVEEEDGK